MVKNVHIHKDTRALLRDASSDKESVDATVNRLLDALGEDIERTRDLYGFTSIKLNEDTVRRLRVHGFSDTEPIDSILKRLLFLYAMSTV